MPEPGPGEILVRRARAAYAGRTFTCARATCRRHPRIIPGHEVVGVVEQASASDASAIQAAAIASASHGCARPAASASIAAAVARISAPTRSSPARTTTAVTASSPSCARTSPIAPDALGDEEAAPLLCAGIIGYRAIKRAGVEPGMTVGLYGFGGSAHLAMQVLQALGMPHVRHEPRRTHRELAQELGADWIGSAEDLRPSRSTRRFSSRPRAISYTRPASARSRRHSRDRGNLSERRFRRSNTQASLLGKRDSQRHREHARRRRGVLEDRGRDSDSHQHDRLRPRRGKRRAEDAKTRRNQRRGSMRIS